MGTKAKSNLLDTITHKKAFSLPKSKAKMGKKGVSSKPAVQYSPKSIKNKAKFAYLEHKKENHFSLHGSLFLIILIPILLVILASFVYEHSYRGKVYQGVRVMGSDIGGKDEDELLKFLDNKIMTYELKVEGENQEFAASLSDIGITYEVQEITNSALSYGRDQNILDNYLARGKRLISLLSLDLETGYIGLKKHDVEPVYKVDEEKLDAFLAEVESKINVAPKDSEIITQGSTIQAIPAVFGRKLNKEILKEEILATSLSFNNDPLKIKAESLAPTIMDEKTEVLARQADEIASKSIVLEHEGRKYFPTKDVVASWITFTKDNAQADWTMSIDQSKMYAYFRTIGNQINDWPVDKKIRVENGTKETVTQEGKNGTVIDEALLGSQVAQRLQNDIIVSLNIPMRTAYYETKKEYIMVANWDKYIDINLSAQRLVAYERGGVVKGSWPTTTGKPGFATPTGTHLVHGKSSWIRMRGMQGTPEAYDLYPVKWVTWFRGGGYAMHDAYWRSSFGYTGSHGCVNLPDAGAIFIYNWADIGTPVVVHY